MSNIKLGSDKFTFDDLENKYRNFIAPGFKLFINNRDAVREGMAITQVQVETTTSPASDTVSFVVANAYNPVSRDFEWLDLLVPGKPLEVHIGYTDRLEPLFFGYVTAVRIDFSSGEAPTISVTGMDLSFKMMRGIEATTWANKKITDVAKEIGQTHGATSFVIDPTASPVPSLPKKPENDYQFLLALAKGLNYEFFVVGKTMYFRKKNQQKTPLMTMAWGKHLTRVHIDLNVADQVTGVNVRGWDPKTQKVIEGSSSSVNKIGAGSRTGADLLKTMGSFDQTLYLNVADKQEAQQKAEAVMNERAMNLLTGDAECIGLPEIRAGRYVRLEGLGKQLNQVYYVQSASHSVDGSGYRTRFSIQGNVV
ncbi:phage late control D family protein [Paenibacillus sp. 1P07SE]|uniref:phage late control D family protein n=1 Tax=Paenibacillus sp. 1P07SE TaxID=3132209 RepID=UPI0039A5462C